MATVDYNDATGNYELIDHGRVVSTHKTAETAKRAGKRYGRQHSQPVSYKGPRMNTTEWIYRPSADDRSGNRHSGGGRHGGFLGLF